MGSVVSKVTDAVGLTDYDGAAKAQAEAGKAVAKATDKSLQIARENIAFQREVFDFQREQHSAWESIYGNIQENLGEYYNNLTASKYATRATAQIASEYQKATRELTQQLAQRGIAGGGAEAAGRTYLAGQKAGAMATVRAEAPEAVAKAKQGFLGIGLGQGTQMLGIQAQQAGNVGSAYNVASGNVLQGGMAQGQIGSAYAIQNLKGSYGMSGQMMETAGDVLGGFIAGSDARLKNNITLIDVVNGINVYTWEWNDTAKALGFDNTPTEGVLAQEIKDRYPEAVSMSKGYYTVNYDILRKIAGV